MHARTVGRVLLTLMCLSSVHAATPSGASASLSDFSIELTDLAPDDGMPPSYAWSSSSTEIRSTIRAPGSASDRRQSTVSGYLTGLTHAHSLPSAALEGTVGPGSVMQIRGTGDQDMSFILQAVTGAIDVYGFILSPHTRLTFSALGTAHTTCPPGAPLDCQGTFARAGVVVDPTGFEQSVDTLYHSPRQPEPGPVSRWLSASFSNLSSQHVALEVYADIALAVMPIPEPQAYVLLAGGVPVIVLLARRRRLAARH